MTSELKNPEFHARLASIVGNERPFTWANKVGISSGAFSRIWNEGTIPSPDLLRKIYTATGISLTWLLTGDGPMRRDDQPPAQTTAQPADDELLRTINQSPRLRSLVGTTVKVLTAPKPTYSNALESNIIAFGQGVDMEEEMEKISKKFDLMEEERRTERAMDRAAIEKLTALVERLSLGEHEKKSQAA